MKNRVIKTIYDHIYIVGGIMSNMTSWKNSLVVLKADDSKTECINYCNH